MEDLSQSLNNGSKKERNLIVKYKMMAAGSAFLKSVESLYDEEERLYTDNLSKLFLPGVYRCFIHVMRSRRMLDTMVKLRERMTPGILGSLVCRNRFIDDVIREAAESDFKSMVNLGAGYDARAWRMPESGDLKIFEVDHPSVINAKMAIVKRSKLSHPPNLTFIPMDFKKQKLKEELEKAGYRPEEKTLYIMEGVTQYITKEAFEETIRYIGKSECGSCVVFSYVPEDVMEHPENYAELRNLARWFRIFHIRQFTSYSQSEMKGYLAASGLNLVEDAGRETFKERFEKLFNRKLSISRAERVARACTDTQKDDKLLS